MAKELGEPDAGNRHRPLEGEEHARPGPLVGLHGEEVVPGAVGGDEFDRAGRHLIGGMPHDRIAERALAGAVGTHQGVDLAAADLQVHPLEDFLPLDGDMKVLDDERVACGGCHGGETCRRGKRDQAWTF